MLRKAVDVEAVTPPVRRLGPFSGAAVVAELLATTDGDAVDEPRRMRAQVTADRGRARLVDEREPLLRLA